MKPNSQNSLMLKEDIEKKNQSKNKIKKGSSQVNRSNPLHES
jgi:hypothetical protein